jgi:acylglycerol lipase
MQGQQLLKDDYKHWPKSLPVHIYISKLSFHILQVLTVPRQLLLIHGTEDQVTSHKASQTFYDEVVADDKKLTLYEVRLLFPLPSSFYTDMTMMVPLTGRIS